MFKVMCDKGTVKCSAYGEKESVMADFLFCVTHACLAVAEDDEIGGDLHEASLVLLMLDRVQEKYKTTVMQKCRTEQFEDASGMQDIIDSVIEHIAENIKAEKAAQEVN